MTLAFDLHWSFRSPYSYLATRRYVDIAREYDVDVTLRIVLPLAVREPAFFKRVNPLWPGYLLRDTLRLSQSLGIPYAWPRPDPVVRGDDPTEYPTEQPYIHRLCRLGVEATRRGCGLPFIDEVSRIIWDGTVDGWNEGDHLANASLRAGLDLADMEATIARASDAYDREIADNQKALERAGHWGVPTAVFQGEPFFGQDRIDLLLWRLEQQGLSRRD